VLGRCLQFVFRRFSEEQIVGRLAHIAGSEDIQVEPEALALLAHVAQGSMRDAVGMLDQLVPLTEGRIELATARELLGITDPGQLDALVDLVLAGKAGEALEALSRIYEGGGELRQVVRGLMERCRDRLVRAIEQRDAVTRERLSTVLDALLHLDGEVRRHAEPRFLVEAILVRLAVEATRVAPAAPAAASTPEVPRPAPEPVAPAAAPVSASPTPPTPPTPVPAAPAASPPAAGQDPADGWRRVLESLTPKTRAYFREASARLEGDCLVLIFPYSFHHKQATESAGQVEPLLRSWLGEGARLELRLQDAAPRAVQQAAPSRRLAPEEDPVIKAAERKLEAKVVRVRPLKEAP
jgi:DNA polymerase-3 subunit gamma/tau